MKRGYEVKCHQFATVVGRKEVKRREKKIDPVTTPRRRKRRVEWSSASRIYNVHSTTSKLVDNEWWCLVLGGCRKTHANNLKYFREQ
jgi:hypothetical protein